MNATREHVRRGVVATMVAAALLAGSIAISGTASAATEYQIGTFNMAGGHEDHGPKGDEAPDALVASVEDRQPAFITLQEACRDWTERLDNELADYTVAFDPAPVADGSTVSAQCKHPSDFGTAILYRNDFGVDTVPDAYDIGLPEMKCVAASARLVVICTTHFTAGDSDEAVAARAAETDRVLEILRKTYAGYTTFLGGDLNATPLDEVNSRFYNAAYGVGATGEFKEVDSPCGNEMKESYDSGPYSLLCRSGESTHDDWLFEEGSPTGKKIDYLFVSPWVEVRSADATHGIHSDHDPLWADVVF